MVASSLAAYKCSGETLSIRCPVRTPSKAATVSRVASLGVMLHAAATPGAVLPCWKPATFTGGCADTESRPLISQCSSNRVASKPDTNYVASKPDTATELLNPLPPGTTQKRSNPRLRWKAFRSSPVQNCLLSNPALIEGADEDFWRNGTLNLLGSAAVGASSSVAANAPNEDRNLLGYIGLGPKVYGLGVIIDGHGGPQVANLVVKNIAVVISKAIEEEFGELSDEQIERETPEAISAIKKGLTKGFLEMDALVRQAVRQSGRERIGACCAVCLISENRIITANAGDGGVVLAWPHKDEAEPNSSFVAVEKLSEWHNCRSESELKRLRTLHPNDPEIVVFHGRTGYVKGMLQPTRCFGDFELKDTPKGTPPYITAQPTFSVKEYAGDFHEPHILLLATDGIWDTLEPEEAGFAALVPILAAFAPEERKLLATNPLKAQQLELTSAQTAANAILLLNLGTIAWVSRPKDVNELRVSQAGELGKHISLLLNVPPPRRRNVMDDMTVGVINLHQMREALRKLNQPFYFAENDALVRHIRQQIGAKMVRSKPRYRAVG